MNSIEEERQVLNESTSTPEAEQEMNPSASGQKITNLYEAFRLLMNTFKKFVYLKPKDYYIASLYILLSYSFHKMDAVPYIYLYGVPGSGKDELLRLFNILGFNPIFVIRMSDAAIKRAISDLQGIFLLDEADVLTKNNGYFLLSIFLNGYKAGGRVYICEKKGNGLIPYSVFGPKVYVTYVWIKNPALLSRSIIFRMEVPDPEKRPEKFILAKHETPLKWLAKQLAELFKTTDVRKRIMKAYTNLERIEGIWGRDEELFSGMRAIAKVIDKEKGTWGPDEGPFKEGMRATINKVIDKEKGIRDQGLLHRLLIQIAQMHIEGRKEQQFFGDRDTQVILAVAGYLKVYKSDEDEFIIGEHIRDYAAEQLHLPPSFRTQDLGKILKDHGLLKNVPKVKWVQWKGEKMQKTSYNINQPRIKKLMEKYGEFMGPSELFEIIKDDFPFEPVDRGPGKRPHFRPKSSR